MAVGTFERSFLFLSSPPSPPFNPHGLFVRFHSTSSINQPANQPNLNPSIFTDANHTVLTPGNAVAQQWFDALGASLYIAWYAYPPFSSLLPPSSPTQLTSTPTSLTLETGIFASQALWLHRTRHVRAAARSKGMSYDAYVAAMKLACSSNASCETVGHGDGGSDGGHGDERRDLETGGGGGGGGGGGSNKEGAGDNGRKKAWWHRC